MSLHILILFSLFYHLGNKSVIYICTTAFNLIKWLVSPKICNWFRIGVGKHFMPKV